MKAIIHIGMPKTGTTSIQTWLKSNRVMLESRGVHSTPCTVHRLALEHAMFEVATREMGVDEVAAWEGSVHARLDDWGRTIDSKDNSTGLKLANRLEAMRNEIYGNFRTLEALFEKMAGKFGIFVYSLETLYRRSEIQMTALDKFLSGFFDERIYVVYIRDPVDLYLSMYSQKLRIFCAKYGKQAFSRFLSRCERDLIPYDTESSFGHLFEWDRVLGDRLEVRLMEPDWLVNGDLIDDFASILGVETMSKPEREKGSLAAEYIEYVRYLNLEFGQTLPERAFKKAIRILTAESAGKPRLAASDAQAKSIHETHCEQNEKIRKRFFPNRAFLYSSKIRGCGVNPAPLTDRRKAKIELEIRKKIGSVGWNPHELALCPPNYGRADDLS